MTWWEGTDSLFAPRVDSRLRGNDVVGRCGLIVFPLLGFPLCGNDGVVGTEIGVDSRSAKTKSPDVAEGRIRAKSTSASGLIPKGGRLLALFAGPPSPSQHASRTTPHGAGRPNTRLCWLVGVNLGGFANRCPDRVRGLYYGDSFALQ